MNSHFWAGRRVLVTGHTGFKGSWLCYWLQQMGAEVSGYALQAEQSPAMYDLLELGSEIPSTYADISDLNALNAAMEQAQPEIVIHMAAQSLVKPSYEAPVETYQTNVMGTVNLLESVRRNRKVRAVIVVTSDKCYENHEKKIPYREQDRLGGFDPYSNSKACAELVTASYRTSYFAESDTAVASVRAGNVIGGGDWSAHRLVPDIICAWQAANRLQVRYPQAIRPWQHVLEPLSGYLMLAEHLYEEGQSYAEAWNFGPAEDGMKPVRYLVDAAKQFCAGFDWYTEPQSHQHEAQTLMLNCGKANEALGWMPKWNIDTALAKTFEWYDAFYAGQDMRAVCDKQLASFMTHSSLAKVMP